MKITADNIGITVQQTGMLSEGGMGAPFLKEQHSRKYLLKS